MGIHGNIKHANIVFRLLICIEKLCHMESFALYIASLTSRVLNQIVDIESGNYTSF